MEKIITFFSAKGKVLLTMLVLSLTMVSGAATVVLTTPAVAVSASSGTPGSSGSSSSSGSVASSLEHSLGTESFNENFNLVQNVGGVFAVIARVVGIFVAMFGLYKLIIALKDQDANGITQAVILLAVGAALIMFKTIMNSVFNLGI